jgi:hypothetical protein
MMATGTIATHTSSATINTRQPDRPKPCKYEWSHPWGKTLILPLLYGSFPEKPLLADPSPDL